MSSAQRLPEIILKRIFSSLVRYSIIASYHRFSNIAHVVKWPITQVCQAWREVGIGIVYREVALSSRDSLTLELAAVAGAINRVRRISLWLDTDSVLCGSAIARLTSPPLDRSVFKFATTLVVHLMGDLPSTGINDELFLDNTSRLCNELRRMFPTAAHLRLDHQWRTGSERWPLYAEDLVRGLFTGKTSVNLADVGQITIAGLFLDGSYLQHIDARKGHVSSQLLEVIRRHAATLQTLDISFLLPMMLRDLVQDADGNPISYPQMHSLGLYCTDFTQDQNTWLFTSPGGVPFPVLQKLVMHMRYPFLNDIMLRGSERTLHDLAMHIDDKAIDTFKRCGVFDSGRLGVVKSVKLMERAPGCNWISENQVLQLLVALCKTRLISFDERFRLSFSIAQPYLCNFSQTLCMLRMPGLECELEQLIALIVSLPLLHTLCATCCRSSIFESESDHEHNGCTDICKIINADTSTDARTFATDLPFARSHIGVACQTMSNAGLLIASRPVISQALHTAEVSLEPGCRPIHRLRLAAIIAILCPSARHIGRLLATPGAYIIRSMLTSEASFMELPSRARARASGC